MKRRFLLVEAPRGLVALMNATLVLSTMLMSGCGLFDPDKGDPPIEQPPDTNRKTPSNLLNHFAQSVYKKPPPPDITEYDQCLHPGFQFVFTDADAEIIGLEFWTKEDDIPSTQSMFDAAIDIDMSLTFPSAPADSEPCLPLDPKSPYCWVYPVDINLTVTVPLEGPDPILTYLVGGSADFAIARDPAAPESLWTIIQIYDKTSVPGGGAPARPLLSNGKPVRPAPHADGPRHVTWGELRNVMRTASD